MSLPLRPLSLRVPSSTSFCTEKITTQLYQHLQHPSCLKQYKPRLQHRYHHRHSNRRRNIVNSDINAGYFKQTFASHCRAHSKHSSAPRAASAGNQKFYQYNHQHHHYNNLANPFFLLLALTALSYTAYSLSSTSVIRLDAIPYNMANHAQIPMPAKLDAASLHAQLLSTAKTQPAGRPGNLTPEEDLKLREFWAKLLEVFGKYKVKPGQFAAAEAPAAETKKSGGFWGRKAAAPTDGNDKFGQSKTFQDAIATMTPQELEKEFYLMIKQDAPDAAVLRYLRARKWDPQAALVMLISTLHWRAKEMKVDEVVMFQGEAGAIKASNDNTDPAAKKEGEDFMQQLRMGKSFQHGFDKDGRPLNYVRVRLHHGGEQTVTSIERFTLYLIETTRFMIRPHLADTGTIVFDMTGFSMANMDYTPVKFMIKVFEANYPESLGAIVIYKAPWIFQGIWKIIKGWLDPVVAAKVHFANNINEIGAYIDPNQVMKECDGNDPYVYQYIEPQEGENAKLSDAAGREKLIAERFAIVDQINQNTIEWIEGRDVQAQRAKLTFDLHLNYYRLDPYIRARSMYDRLGLIPTHNQLGWDPAAVQAALA